MTRGVTGLPRMGRVSPALLLVAVTLIVGMRDAEAQPPDDQCLNGIRLYYYTGFGGPELCVPNAPGRTDPIDLRGRCAIVASDGSCEADWEGHVFSYRSGMGAGSEGWLVSNTADICPSRGSTLRFRAGTSERWLSRRGGTTFRYVMFGVCVDHGPELVPIDR